MFQTWGTLCIGHSHRLPVQTPHPGLQPGQPFLPILSHNQSPYSTSSGLPVTFPQTTLLSAKSLSLMRAMISCPSETFMFSTHHKVCLQTKLLPLSLGNTSGHPRWGTALVTPPQALWFFLPQLDKACCNITLSGS